MTNRDQWLVVTGAVALLAGGLVVGSRLSGDSLAQVTVGAQAPDFKAETMDGSGRTKGIADYKGHVVLINLWATWCGPCIVEMPSIQRLYDQYRDAGLKVVAIAVDDPGFDDRIREFVAERNFTFEILHEGSGKIENDYQTSGIPATYLIGKDGRIRKMQIGASEWDSPANAAVVAQLLGVRPVTPAVAPGNP
jgi:cytochrome c biogenesis protein CcmG, thiol:disulfide interchange protein DsbE